jgi:hypothetical protein
MNLDRQMQWKSFSGTGFSHNASSARLRGTLPMDGISEPFPVPSLLSS